MSPRNSPVAVVNMLKKTNCHYILIIAPLPDAFLGQIREQYNAQLRFVKLPHIVQFFPKLGSEKLNDPFEPFPYVRPHQDEVASYLHSSGSTGFPKPIALSHIRIVQWLRQCIVFTKQISQSPSNPSRNTKVQLGVAAFPSFHALGYVTQLYAPLVSDAVASVFRPTSLDDPDAQPIIPTPDAILENARLTHANVIYVVPSFLEEMQHSKKYVDALKTYDRVVSLHHFHLFLRFCMLNSVCQLYGGGILPEKVGERLFRSGVPLTTSYGGTEFGAPAVPPDIKDCLSGDWNYFYFPDRTQVRFVDQGDGTYELQILVRSRSFSAYISVSC